MMTTANDLIVVFLALEILSIPLYVLAAFDRRRLSSQEAGIKYFVLGAFSSAIFLYGIALVYGATGTTSLTGIAHVPRAEHAVRAGHAAGRVRAAARRPRVQGGGGAVPHVDARRLPGRAHAGHRVHGVGHEGRRVRRAAARVHGRVPAVPRPTGARWSGCSPCSRSSSAASAPLLQTDVKRLLAYSSIAHAATCSWRSRPATPQGREAALFYLFVYTFMVDRLVRGRHGASHAGRRRRTRSTATAASAFRRPGARQPARASSCSRRPASRSPAASSPSSRCSPPPPARASTCWSSIGAVATVIAGVRVPAGRARGRGRHRRATAR